MLIAKIMPKASVAKASFLSGLIGTIALLGIYFTVLTLVSGWDFTLTQFLSFWYFILALSIGFGIQVGLYSYVRTGKVIAVSGTTSTVAMISCCSHYLVNLLPIIGITGFITLVSQYQIELFWVGIIANLLGIVYMARRIRKASK